MKCWLSFRHAENGATTWSTKGLWYTPTTNLFSTFECNLNSIPTRCIGQILWLTIGWTLDIGQARPILFCIPCQGHHAAPLWRQWGQPKPVLWTVRVCHRLLANRLIHWSWHDWSGWAPLLLNPNGWGKCMRCKLTLLLLRWSRFKQMPQVKMQSSRSCESMGLT